MTRTFHHLMIFVIMLVSATFAATAETRVALVVGNSSYDHTSNLENTRNDASDISAKLQKLGFSVTKAHDLPFDPMRRALRSFAKKAQGADMAVVYFAGHGIEVNKNNYLIPTDARLETDRDISYEAIPLQLVTDAVAGATALKLVILDACRNNPFASSMKRTNGSRSIGRGLARIEPTAGTLVAFAAREGTVASDGSGRNSPYTKALLKHLEQPDLEINFLFRRVRDTVMQITGNQQQPFTYGSLPGRKIFINQGGSSTDQPEKPKQKVASIAPAEATNQPATAFSLSDVDGLLEVHEPEQLRNMLANTSSGALKEMIKYRSRSIEEKSYSPIDRFKKSSEGDERTADEIVNAITRQVGSSSNRDLVYLERELGIAAVKSQRSDLMNTIAMFFYHNRKTRKDSEAAYKWLMESALRGNPQSFSNLGVFYQDGLAVRQSGKLAIEFYTEAVNRGAAAEGYNQLGYIYQSGGGVAPNPKRAFDYFEKAYAVGSPAAAFNLGYFFANGIGRRRDAKKATAYFFESLEAGYQAGLTQITNDFNTYSVGVRREIKQQLKARGLLKSFKSTKFDQRTKVALEQLTGTN